MYLLQIDKTIKHAVFFFFNQIRKLVFSDNWNITVSNYWLDIVGLT